MKRYNKSILFILVFLFSISFVLAEETGDATTDTTTSTSTEVEGFSAQNGFDWLVDAIDSDGSVGSDVTKTAYAIMALDAAGYDTSASLAWLETKLSTDFCYPLTSCTSRSRNF